MEIREMRPTNVGKIAWRVIWPGAMHVHASYIHICADRTGARAERKLHKKLECANVIEDLVAFFLLS